MTLAESAPYVDCPHPAGVPCGLCKDTGLIKASLLYPGETVADVAARHEEARIWTDLTEPPATTWWSSTDTEWLGAVVWALVRVAVDGVRRAVLLPCRWRWGP